jgi:hypothetical protein
MEDLPKRLRQTPRRTSMLAEARDEARPRSHRRPHHKRDIYIPLADVCTVDGCRRTTNDRKPFCLDHIDRMPYARQIASEIEARDREALAVGLGPCDHVDLAGSRAREIVDVLRCHRALSLERLAELVCLDHETFTAYARALERAGLVRMFSSCDSDHSKRPVHVVAIVEGEPCPS